MLLCAAGDASVQGSDQLTVCLSVGHDTCFACAQNDLMQEIYFAHMPMFMQARAVQSCPERACPQYYGCHGAHDNIT